MFHDLLRVALNHEPVRRDSAGNERLAESPAGFYDNAVEAARDRVGGEDHAGCITGDELLHDDGHCRLVVLKPVLGAVVERPFGPERSPAPFDEFDAAVGVGRPQIRVVEPCERMAGKVFGSPGRADRDEWRSEPLEGSADFLCRLRREFARGYEFPDCGEAIALRFADPQC